MNILLLVGVIGACAVAFLVGSFPTAFVIGKILRGIDIRNYGSRNSGATNAGRVLGKMWEWIVTFVDVLKGFLIVTIFYSIISGLLAPFYPSLAFERNWSHELFYVLLGACVISGHIWSVFLCGKGGKGVATSAGVMLGIDPFIAGIGIVVFYTTKKISHYVSLSSLVATASVALVSLVLCRPAASVIFTFLLAFVVWMRHRDNIVRLRNGTEPKNT